MSDRLRAQLQSTLGDAYTLERELGGGEALSHALTSTPRLGKAPLQPF